MLLIGTTGQSCQSLPAVHNRDSKASNEMFRIVPFSLLANALHLIVDIIPSSYNL